MNVAYFTIFQTRTSHSGGHLSTCTADTGVDDTMTRLSSYPPVLNSYENGRVTHLDLAAHGPNCNAVAAHAAHAAGAGGIGGSVGHIPPNLVNDVGGFLTTSLSAAALNQPAGAGGCAVPMHQHGGVGGGGHMSVTSTPGGPSAGGWVTANGRQFRPMPPQQPQQPQRHQEQCPHFNYGEEPPS